MASAIIHLAIAKKVNEKIKVDNQKDYYLGAIAPDISKQIGESREQSHFLINTTKGMPNIDLFKKRYPTFMYNSFNLGYFTHLYADKCWEKNFLPNIKHDNFIKLTSGIFIKTTTEEINKMIYSDYTNLNIKVIEEYDLDLSLFYEDFIIPKTEMKEIPINNLDILINKMGILIENSKSEKTYTLDIEKIKLFIEETATKIINELQIYN